MRIIDVTYDFRKDSKCGDPDTDSLKLYEAQKTLWNKTLLSGKSFDFEIINDKFGRFLLKNKLTMNLSSDRMCPHFVGRYKGKFEGWLSKTQEEEFQYKVRTIGGHIVFPAHRKDGFTINQARGVSRQICDRFDLTIECIKRFYESKESPLSKAIERYEDFFTLFRSFQEYVDFFHLQDFLTKDRQVNFTIPFDDFKRSPLPLNIEEYKSYMKHTLGIIEKRNYRILKINQEMVAGNNV